jgi:Uma2 family endonuclease
MEAMAATTLLTSDQFLAMPEELDQDSTGIRQELICGEVISVPPPAHQHDIIRGNILQSLIAYVLANPSVGMKVLPDIAFVISGSSIFVPDVNVVAIERLSELVQKYVPGAPDLAIEVVSPNDTVIRLKEKIDSYLANGSRSVWIVFPKARSVMVYTRESVRELKGDQSITDPLLPGFSIPVAAFFELT